MEKEAYVSFEVARLLKDKGFDAQCRAAYTNYGKLFTIQIQQYITNVLCSKGYLWDCIAPTHQMAMKWLQEEHHIHIGINPISGKGYYATIYDVADFDDYGIISTTECFFHVEQACEAAIKYCLENLI